MTRYSMPPKVPVWVFPPADDRETKMTQNILIVEDEVDLALGIRDALMHAGFRADVVHNPNAFDKWRARMTQTFIRWLQARREGAGAVA